MGLDEGLGNLVPVKQLLVTCRNFGTEEAATVFSAAETLERVSGAAAGLCCLSPTDCLFNSFIGSRYGSGVALTIFMEQFIQSLVAPVE